MAAGRKIVKDLFFPAVETRHMTVWRGPHSCCCTTLHEKGWVSNRPRNVFLVLLNPEAAECCFSCLDLLLADIPSLFSCVRHLNIANTFGSAFNYYLVPAWFAIVTLHLKRQCDLSIHQSIVDFQKKKKKWLFRACSPVWKWTKKVKKWPLNHRTARLGWFNGPVKMTSIEKKKNWVRVII
jgi:hypothetical protein